MVRDTVEPPRGGGPAGVPRRRALLRRLPRQPRLRARGAAHGVRGGGRGRRAVRHQRRHAARLGRRRRARRRRDAPASGSASTATTTPAARSPTRWRPSTPAPPTCRARSTATASGPATPTSSRWWPTSSSSCDRQVLPTGAAARGDPHRARGRRGHERAADSRQPYVGTVGVRAQGRAARQRDQGRPEPLPARSTPVAVGNDMRLLVSDMAGRASIELKGRELGFDLAGDQDAGHPGDRPGQGAGVARLHVRGRRRVLRAAARRGGRGRSAVVLRRRVVAGHHRVARQAGAG